MGEFSIEKNNFLVFEEGPSVDMKLQWATYRDAADQCALSRIWGGIHPYVDDIPGRKIGKILGRDAFEFAKKLFEPQDIVTRNNERSNSFTLYPNPVNSGSQLTIYNESSLSIYRVSIISLSGQVVLSENMFDLNKKIILNLDKLPRGIYIVNITFEDGSSKSTKIIINK